MRFFYTFILMCWVFSSLAHAGQAPLAFPEAEGFGQFAKGGRGGQVIEVTNLKDTGPGSLRDALMAKGPRTVVFRVSGNITLSSPIRIVEPFLTVAGQTAPGDGILIRGNYISIRASHVIMRYLRIRPGISGADPTQIDAQSVERGSSQDNDVTDIIIDHCSMSWGEDEVASISGSRIYNVTFQWSTIGESLNAGGGKGRGAMVAHGATNATIHHNLIHSNWDRSPLIESGNVDLVNNVIYNYGNPGSTFWAVKQTRVNWEKNYYKTGPLLKNEDYYPPINLLGDQEFNATSGVWLHGNYHAKHRPNELTDPETNMVRHKRPGTNLVSTRYPFPTVRTTLASVAYDEVLAHAGANLVQKKDGTFRSFMDDVDKRYIKEVTTTTGPANPPTNLIDVGGYPTINGGMPPQDTDHDGMPDSWELTHGFNPKDRTDGPKDKNGNGYTNLEEYLNGVALAVVPDNVPPMTPKDVRLVSN